MSKEDKIRAGSLPALSGCRVLYRLQSVTGYIKSTRILGTLQKNKKKYPTSDDYPILILTEVYDSSFSPQW